MRDGTLLKIGGCCALAVTVAILAGSAYALPRFDTVNIYDLEAGEALPKIVQHSRELQVILSGEILAWLMLIPFWLALYLGLKERQHAYALLGAVAGILSSLIAVVLELPGAGLLPTLAQRYVAATDETSVNMVLSLYDAARPIGLGFALTALRAPQVGLVSMALLRGGGFARWVAGLGIAVAVLTLIEVVFWIAAGSPNDPLPVGGVAAVLGIVWTLLAGVWLLRGSQPR